MKIQKKKTHKITSSCIKINITKVRKKSFQFNEVTKYNAWMALLQTTQQIYLKNWFDVTIYIHVKMQICWANSCSELQKVMNFSNERSLFLVQLSIHQSTVKWWKKLNIDLYIWNTKHWFICMKYYTLIFVHTWCTVWHTDWSFRQVKKWSARIYSASLKNIKIKCGSLCI